MLNLNNFILPFRIEEERVKVLDKTKEALLVKSTGEPFFVSKISILPPKNSSDIFSDSLISDKGIIRYSPLGYLPTSQLRIAPFTAHIPFYSMTGDLPPLPEEPFRRLTPTKVFERLDEIERVIEYLFAMRRPDFAFAIAFLYLYRPYKKRRLWFLSSRNMNRMIWEGVPHISNLYFIDSLHQTILVPKTSNIYKALSIWWGISGGYHNTRRLFMPCALKELYTLCNSIHSPLIQCQVSFTFKSFFRQVKNTALLPINKDELSTPPNIIHYKGAMYANNIPYYYSKKEDTGIPDKVWWDDSWFNTLTDYIDPLVFLRIKKFRAKRLPF